MNILKAIGNRSTLRVILCISIIFFPDSQFKLLWLPVIPWAILCGKGILLSMPVILMIFFSAAGAQADWMSDSLMYFLFFVFPTFMAIVLDVKSLRIKRKFSAACRCILCSSKEKSP